MAGGSGVGPACPGAGFSGGGRSGAAAAGGSGDPDGSGESGATGMGGGAPGSAAASCAGAPQAGQKANPSPKSCPLVQCAAIVQSPCAVVRPLREPPRAAMSRSG